MIRWVARRLCGMALMLSAATGAGCGSGGGSAGTGDVVTGGGYLVYSDVAGDIPATVWIHAATLDPGTTTATGWFSLQQEVGWWKGIVTSLVLEGSVLAVAGGVITDASEPSYLGRGFYEVVLDGASAGVPDRSQAIFLPPGDPGPWVGPVDLPIFVMVSGDYVVFDG